MTLGELRAKLAELTLPDNAIVLLSDDTSPWQGELTEVSWDNGGETEPPYVWLYANS